MHNVLYGFAAVLDTLLTGYQWIVIIRAILSWVSPDPRNPLVRALSALTDPLFLWMHRRVRLYFGGLDFAPLVVIVVIIFLKYAVVDNLYEFAGAARHSAMMGR